MNRFVPIILLTAVIGLGGCVAGVGYGSYGGTYYSNAYPVPEYGYDYPFGSIGLGGVWVGGGHRHWDRWHGFHNHPRYWGGWHRGAFHPPGGWAGRGHFAGHGWHR